ncbi:hypothetical protein ABB55_06315 [Prosthecomicrobium hirschii]|uniref:Uncharacterized protein n=1 Tax=Prosthecodimorpha hirschii TaxID=665126 RepID=A0A0P6VIF4_9HYPH|nr:glycosyltransferase [Prosthecomicrobium hirschii]KPL51888.1 hypothetical protein ABB55_06315 [Prosthecomicrobium hirschii]
MKRLQIIASVHPAGGGPIEGIRQQATVHATAGIVEHIVSLDPPDAPWVADFPFPLFACGEPMAATRRWKRWLPWRRYGYQPGFARWLMNHVAEYDVVVVNGLWNYATMGARLILPRSGVPYAVFTHGMLDPWFKRTYPLKGALKQLFWLFNEGVLLRHAARVLFTTEEERIRARGAFLPYRVRDAVVGYGTSDPLATSDATDLDSASAAFRARVPGVTRPYLLYLSRIHPKKGCDLLLDAFAAICAEQDLDLVMAGPAAEGYQTALRRQTQALGIADRVHWPGMVQGAAKWGAYHGAVAFVLPSHQENFGVVVAEAMACRRPVLISDKVNIWREVDACGGGLIEPDTVDGVTRLLRRFLVLTPAARVEMGERGRAGFLEHFEIRNAAQALNLVLQEVARREL